MQLETDSPATPVDPAKDSGSSAVAARPRMTRLAVSGMQAVGLGGFYFLTLVYFSIQAPHFFEFSNAVNILSNVSVIGIVTLGQMLVLIAGGFDLSVSGTLPLGGVIFTILINRGVNLTEAWVISTLAGGAIGINPLVTTLGTLSITGGLANVVTAGETVPFDDLNAGIVDNNFLGMPIYIWVWLATTAVVFLVLRFTVLGRMIYSIGGNREASRLAGIRVDLVTTLVYVISGALSAFSGVVLAQQLLAGAPSVGATAALTSIASVILGGAALTGGVGGVPGTVVGVLVLGTVANGLALLEVPSFYQQIATGAILLLAVGFGRLRALITQFIERQ
jgi:ribose transport system permease protein